MSLGGMPSKVRSCVPRSLRPYTPLTTTLCLCFTFFFPSSINASINKSSCRQSLEDRTCDASVDRRNVTQVGCDMSYY